jgi:hypothetical protein
MMIFPFEDHLKQENRSSRGQGYATLPVLFYSAVVSRLRRTRVSGNFDAVAFPL